MRREVGVVQRFAFRETYPKDECTYEANSNIVQFASIANKTPGLGYADGSSKEARVLSQLNVRSNVCELQLEGASARVVPRGAQRRFNMDMVEWSDSAIIGWRLKGYNQSIE